ncbi:uncharacterized protein LOC123005243 [Tribolium madens]|uniref:uncharacterized protein LOC123005243 n=1 Tax=Tribolium madens TaxID=41895 RepID=UPI001CF75493|nr:uncharacterized protein LOC123005243 [Tribolium madens]
MPKFRRTSRGLKRLIPTKTQKEVDSRQLNFVQRDKENNHKSVSETVVNDPLLSFMKIEVKEELDSNQDLDFGQEINIPLKIEQFETLEIDSIKQEESVEPESDAFVGTSNNDLNMLIEWALNLQFDHSKKCSGRLYPCKNIFDQLSCKIIVLYCTVCKKRMLHTLKDWAML